METYNLISLADISANVRPCYADEQLADTCITEAQNVDLRSQFYIFKQLLIWRT